MTENIKNDFYPTVEKALSNPKAVKEFIDIVSKYIDRNTDNLSTIGPIKNIIFWEERDRDPVFNLVGITKGAIKAAALKIPELKRSVNASDPFNILMVMIIRFFRLHKMESERKAAGIYLLLSMYPSLFGKYFKFKPNENIMAYTINTMSGKFKIKQHGTVLNALVDISETCDEHYIDEIKRFTDKDVALYISALKTRANSFLKNIFSEFLKNHRSGKYMNYEEDNSDPDNFSVADSNSLLIQRISQAVTLQLSVSGPNSKCVTLAAKMNKVSLNDMRNTVNLLCKDRKNMDDIRKVISAILYDYLFTGKNSQDEIKSTKFTIYTINTYKKSNTNDTNIVLIKEILDKWLNAYSERYKKTNRVSTLNEFRRALYMFFVFTIQNTRF